MAAIPIPTPYAYRAGRMPPASDPQAVNDYLVRELRTLERTIDGLLDFIPRASNVEPRNALPGMIRMAVSPWRPVQGQNSDMWVYFTGAAWIPLNTTYMTMASK